MGSSLMLVGWREWISLPELGINAIKAKVDTGARTSTLHAYFVEPFSDSTGENVRFGIHPVQHNTNIAVTCVASVIDIRKVTDSGGHQENRFVIKTPIQIGGHEWNVEMTLTNRDTMLFRLLLGRTAMRNRIIVNPAKSYLMGKELKNSPPLS